MSALIEISRLVLHLFGAAVGGMVGFEIGFGFSVLFFYIGKHLTSPSIANKIDSRLIWSITTALTTCAGSYIGWYIPNIIASLM